MKVSKVQKFDQYDKIIELEIQKPFPSEKDQINNWIVKKSLIEKCVRMFFSRNDSQNLQIPFLKNF